MRPELDPESGADGDLTLADATLRQIAVAPHIRVTVLVADLINMLEGRRGARLPRVAWQPLVPLPQRGEVILLKLEAGGTALSVLLRADRLIERLGLTAFSNDPAGRGAALWTLRARRWWTRLEAWLGTPLRLHSATRAESIGDWPCFRIRVGRLDALLWLDPEEAARCVAIWPIGYGSQSDWIDRLGELPVACRLALNNVSLRVDEFEYLATGDVVLITRRADAPLKGYLTSREARWRCALHYEREGRISMTDNTVELYEDGADGPDPDTRVELTLELGHCLLTLGELSRLREGLVLNLHRPLDDLNIVLRYRGRRIARGCLLQVGESLGIRLADVELGTICR
ncbi:flagellar motor switch/type III secretory pathway protein FliN [Burkholderia ambifaria]|nr:FliM/FliN family flagellar motor switch protein [Burkholderia ambifaria]MDR6504017.1 flagellar motor switch/type III secretory pathway protein FliN [Burkholderia ambifaria]